MFFTYLTQYPDKVQRELSLVVSRHGCAEGDKCEISCRVELVSGKDTDHVTWHNCLDTQNGNEIVRTKRGAVGGFKQVCGIRLLSTMLFNRF